MDINEAYVTGLLADLERRVPQLEGDLQRADARAAAIDAELSNLLRRLQGCRDALAQAQAQAGRSAAQITEHNLRISALHQEIATLKRRGDDIKIEMDRVGAGVIHRRLRRERAKLTVQSEDRQAEIDALRDASEGERLRLSQAEGGLARDQERLRAITQELDKLQDQLPSPYLFTQLFETIAGRAHCRLYLDRDPAPWRAQMRRAIDRTEELHKALRAGKYRLDKNSELVGGRAMATAEALYGAVLCRISLALSLCLRRPRILGFSFTRFLMCFEYGVWVSC
ncbi:MAG: hypothetical protein R3C68_15890 [Myxococcota bacterium]